MRLCFSEPVKNGPRPSSNSLIAMADTSSVLAVAPREPKRNAPQSKNGYGKYASGKLSKPGEYQELNETIVAINNPTLQRKHSSNCEALSRSLAGLHQLRIKGPMINPAMALGIQ